MVDRHFPNRRDLAPLLNAELVALRVGHNHVVPRERVARDRAGRAEPSDLVGDARPLMLRRAIAGHSQIEMQAVLRSLGLGHLKQAQPRRNAVRVMQPRRAHPVVVFVGGELREPLVTRRERRRRGFVDVPGGGLPELGQHLRVRTVEGEIDPCQHVPPIRRGVDNFASGDGERRGRPAGGRLTGTTAGRRGPVEAAVVGRRKGSPARRIRSLLNKPAGPSPPMCGRDLPKIASDLLRWPAVPAAEKGVDVALAIDVVRLAMTSAFDAAMVCSADTDLMPAIETVYDLHLAQIELATWAGARRLRFPSTQLPWCQMISVAQYLTLADTTDYTAR